jgi:hypothetical protein
MNKGFLGLLGLVIMAGLSVGSLFARNSASPAPTAAPASVAQAASAAVGAARTANVVAPATGSTPGPGAADRRMASGSIEKIGDQAMTVRTANGLLEIALTEQTTYQKMATGKLADLKVGDTVSVRGDSTGDSAINATTLQVMPAGGQAGQAGQAGFAGRTAPDGAGPGRPGQGGLSGTPPGVAGGAAGGRPGQAGAGPGGVVFGSIQSIDGQTVTLSTPAGSVKVTLADSTQIRQTVTASRTDLAAGQTVTIVGQAVSEGSIRALAVTITTT